MFLWLHYSWNIKVKSWWYKQIGADTWAEQSAVKMLFRTAEMLRSLNFNPFSCKKMSQTHHLSRVCLFSLWHKRKRDIIWSQNKLSESNVENGMKTRSLFICLLQWKKKTHYKTLKNKKTLQNKTHLCNCCFLRQAFEVAEMFTAPPSLSFMDNTLTHGPRREWWCWCFFLCSWCNRMSQTVTLRFNFMPNV